MTMKAVVSYLDYRLKANEEEALFRVFVAENLATISAGQKFIEKYNTIWGVPSKRDTRSAKKIIEDTFAARGVKVKWHNGESE